MPQTKSQSQIGLLDKRQKGRRAIKDQFQAEIKICHPVVYSLKKKGNVFFKCG